MPQPEMILVGDGIVGSAVALALTLAGTDFVWLAPARPIGAASHAAGAMLGVLGEVVGDSDLAEGDSELALRVRASLRYPGWLGELAELARKPVVPRSGTFVVADAGRESDGRAMASMEKAAARFDISCERVDAADVPGLRPAPTHAPAGVLALPSEGFVDAPQLCAALAHAVERGGRATRIDDVATGLVVRYGCVCGVQTATHGALQADEVVLCTGAGTPELLAASQMADVVPVVLASKGASLVLREPKQGRRDSRFEHVLRTPNREFACGLHLVPRGDGMLYVGATNRVSRYLGVTGEVTASDLLYLLDGVTKELSVDLERWNLHSTSYGYRPLTVDGIAVAGRTAVDGLSVATGSYRNGVLLAPLLADAVVQGLRGSGPTPGEQLSPARPREHASGADALRSGLADFALLLEDAGASWWRSRREAIIEALGVLGAAGERPEALRRQVNALMERYPRPEIVPEALIELLQEVDHAG